MDTLVSVLQRLEAKLDAIDSRPSASRPPRPDPDPPYGMSSEWQAPSWTSEGLATHSVGVSILPWPPTMSSISSWPQSDPFRQNLHEYTNGMGFHTTGPHQYPSWEPPRSRAGDFIGHRSSWEQSASRGPSSTQGPSSSYEFDPILGRPLTSWDLPRPRIAPESCSNHSDWDYWVPPTYSESYGGGGGYSKYSNNYNDYYNNEPQAWPYNHESSYSHCGGGYSGGGYANEHSPYVPPPFPPQDSCYMPAPQPNPPSRLQPQQPDGGYVPAPPSYTPPPHPRDSPCSLTTLNDVQFTTSIERREMDVAGKDGGVEPSSNGNEDSGNYHTPNMPSEWQVNGNSLANTSLGMMPICNSMVETSACSSPSMVELFCAPIWEHSMNGQNLGYCDVNMQTDATTSSTLGNVRADLGWNPNAMLRGSMFLPLVSGMLPSFPADSGFIERAARFSCFNGGNFSEMLNHFAVPDPMNPYARSLGIVQGQDHVLEGENVFLEVWRRLVIFCLYELAEVYKEFDSPP